MTESPASGQPPVRTSVLRLGLPLVLAMGGHAFFNLVDLAMVGAYHASAEATELTIAGVTIVLWMPRARREPATR